MAGPSYNKSFVIGRLGQDPELRRTAGGTAVLTMSVATERSWTDGAGERQSKTTWVPVTVWDRQAENCAEYLRKGSLVHVEGRLEMEEWTDKTTGEKRSKLKITAEQVTFLSPKSDDQGGGRQDDYDREPEPPRQPRRNDDRQPSRREPQRGSGPPPARGGGSPARGSAPRGRPAPEPSYSEEDDIPF